MQAMTWLRTLAAAVLLLAGGPVLAASSSGILGVGARVVRAPRGQARPVLQGSQGRLRPERAHPRLPPPGSLRLESGGEVKQTAGRSPGRPG